MDTLCGQLNLCEEEQETILVEEDCPKIGKMKEKRSLMGKNYADKNIRTEAIRVPMGKIWRLSKPDSLKEVGRNTFIVTSATDADKQRVVEGKLWLFDNNLFVPKNLDGYSQITKAQFNTKSFGSNYTTSQASI